MDDDPVELLLEALEFVYESLRGPMDQRQVANLRREVHNALQEFEAIHPT